MDYARVQAAYRAGDFAGCEAMVRDGLAAFPEDPRLLHDLGAALLAQGRFSAAAPVFERFHAIEPRHRLGAVSQGKARLGMGDFAGGWPLYDERLRLPNYFTEIPPFPAWAGEPLAGKTLVVWREQGFGDMIMCLRFLPILRQMGVRVIAVTRPPLARLYASLGFETAAHGGEPGTLVRLPIEPDFHTHPFSIPRWLGVTVEAIPAAAYLHSEPEPTQGRIGVVWRGRPTHQHDALRSLPAELGAALLALPGAVSLEPADTGAGDFLDTARLIAGLERVITVDTAVAHLAGALGKPVSILLPAHGVDWRWMEARTDSPWYPSADLRRQTTPGDWRSVVDEVLATTS